MLESEDDNYQIDFQLLQNPNVGEMSVDGNHYATEMQQPLQNHQVASGFNSERGKSHDKSKKMLSLLQKGRYYTFGAAPEHKAKLFAPVRGNTSQQ